MLKRYACRPSVLHERNVLGIAAVVIAGDVAGVAVGHAAGRVAEAMPDARAGAVRERRSFDLVGGGCGAPEETVGEADVRSCDSVS